MKQGETTVHTAYAVLTQEIYKEEQSVGNLGSK
jgi:hypothetical protein